jgi:hypothetical protein
MGFREYRCVRLVEGFVAMRPIHRWDLRISVNWRFPPRLQRGSSYPVRNLLCCHMVLHVFFSPCSPSHSLSPSLFSGRRRPSPHPFPRRTTPPPLRGGGQPWPLAHNASARLCMAPLWGYLPAPRSACPPGGGALCERDVRWGRRWLICENAPVRFRKRIQEFSLM